MKSFRDRAIRSLLLIGIVFGIGLKMAYAGVVLQQTLIKTATEVTGYSGSGADGAISLDGTTGPNNTYKTDTTKTYLSSASAYSAGATSLTVASSSGFAAGHVVLIIQMLGTDAGQYEFQTVSSVAAGNITLTAGLKNSYPGYAAGSNVVQVLRVPQYSSVTLNSGAYVTATPWNGTTGGVVAFYSSGAVTINYNATYSGRIVATGLGYQAGSANATGAGPGGGAAGAGGRNTSPGSERTRLVMGSGGGGGSGGAGGVGGGILIMKVGGTLTINGAIYADGGAAAASSNGGGGAGGTISISADQITGSACGPMTANGGAQNGTGTVGGAGRIFQAYKTSNSCTNASPSASYMKFILK